jgi:hypothetical protein
VPSALARRSSSPRRRAVHPLRRVAAVSAATGHFADSRAARRCLPRVEPCPGARVRARRRVAPPLAAAGHRVSCHPPLLGRSHAISAVGLRSDAPVQSHRPQAVSTLGSRSNGSRSGQNLVNQSDPAGPGSFAKNPPSFLEFTDIPFHLRRFPAD